MRDFLPKELIDLDEMVAFAVYGKKLDPGRRALPFTTDAHLVIGMIGTLQHKNVKVELTFENRRVTCIVYDMRGFQIVPIGKGEGKDMQIAVCLAALDSEGIDEEELEHRMQKMHRVDD